MAQVPVKAGQVNVSDIASVIASDPVAQAALADRFLPNTGGTITGETILCYPGGDPCLWFKDPTFPCDSGGLWRILMENDTLSFQRNTGVFTHSTINVINATPDAFVIPGSFVSQFPIGFTFLIVGGPNAGTYTVHPTGASFAAGNTTIPVVETIPAPGTLVNQLDVCDFSGSDVPLEMTSLNLVSTVPVTIAHPQGLEFPVPASTIRFFAPNGSIQFMQSGAQISSGVFPIEIVALSLTSSAPIAMNPPGTRKITGLANGTVSGDALHFGQIDAQVQAFDATLTSIALLGTVADRIAYTTGVDTWAETPLTSFARTLIDDATALAARITLGVVIGTDVQAFDAELTGLAALSGTGIVVKTGAGAFIERSVVAGVGVAVTNGSGASANPSVAVAAFKGTAVFDFASIAANTSADTTVTVTGAVVGDPVAVTVEALESGLVLSAFISSANTATVRLGNVTIGAIDPASHTFNVIAFSYASF